MKSLKLLIYTFISVFFIVYLFSCKNPTPQHDISSNTPYRINSSYYRVIQNFLIYKELKEIDKTQFPRIVSLYFKNEYENLTVRVLDNYTMKFSTHLKDISNEIVIHLFLSTQGNKKYFFISGIRKDSIFYQNYFYVLEKHKNKINNVTLNLIPDDVIQIFKLTLNTELHYQRRDNFWAFYTGITHYALSFRFKRNNINIYKCFLPEDFQDNCKIILYLTWENDKFKFRLPEPKMPNSDFLTQNQLDRVKRYTSLMEALAEFDRVYILDLDGVGLTTLPASIAKLSKLQVLILNNNYLDSLPQQIGQLTHLQILRAENNHLKTLPKSIGNLIYLQELNLANNNLTWLPYELANLTHIEKLNLSGNDLEVLAFDMSKMDMLVSVDLSRNKFEKIPYQIFKLKNLKYLNLSNNPIKVLPKELLQMPNLEFLVIKNTKIDTAQILYVKKKRPSLQIVY